MSLAILKSRAQIGTSAPRVTIEVFLSGGLPGFSIVGMPATAVRESKDRVRSALLSSGFRFPQDRITVSLGPADMPKKGGRFDLAIALGILAASGQLPAGGLDDVEFYGELALNGALRGVPGVLPAALRARDAGRALFVPGINADEAALVSDQVYAADSLLEITSHLAGRERLAAQALRKPSPGAADGPDLADVAGQARAKRALEITAAGGHNLLFVGPPGTGKSMLAARLPPLLPPMSEHEALETAAIESVLGVALDLDRWRRRPFRAPHHTASAPALIGGGSEPRPGEVSRAHHGVLFLDELPEFDRNVLEVLREPLEEGRITISRASGQADFPARFQLVAAMNPCPCGYLGDRSGRCSCSAERVARYRGRISGPLLDRIDLAIEVPRVSPENLARRRAGEGSRDVRRRVVDARRRQADRAGSVNCMLNAVLDGDALDACCTLDADARQMLTRASERFGLSIRGYQRVRRVARTIADLADEEGVDARHVAEALSLRGFDAGDRPARRYSDSATM